MYIYIYIYIYKGLCGQPLRASPRLQASADDPTPPPDPRHTS